MLPYEWHHGDRTSGAFLGLGGSDESFLSVWLPIMDRRIQEARVNSHLPVVELIYFKGCPNVESARANLRTALSEKGLTPEWREWDQTDDSAPARVKQYGSPTVLVDDEDVTGAESVAAMACTASGAPSADQILRALG